MESDSESAEANALTGRVMWDTFRALTGVNHQLASKHHWHLQLLVLAKSFPSAQFFCIHAQLISTGSLTCIFEAERQSCRRDSGL